MILVIGAGLSGLRTVEGLRRHGYAGRVALVGSESAAPYDRPPLSKAMFAEETVLPLLPADQLDALRAEVILGSPVVALDTGAKTAVLADGRHVEYDQAVIAVGVIARTLPGLAGANTLRTRADRDQIRQQVRQSGSLLVVGAGFLGCEVAASARVHGAEVTLIEPQPTPLAGVLGSDLGAEVAALHRDHGVDLRCGASVSQLIGDVGNWAATLTDGSPVGAGTCLVAAGSALDLAWLDGSGIKIENGVLCDEFGRTSVESVWAVGDCSAWWHSERAAYVRREHWTHAGDQAEVVARSIATSELSALQGPAYFWSDQYGLKIQALGDPTPNTLVDVLRVGPEDRPFAIYAADGVVSAVVGFGLPRYVMKSRSLIGAAAVGDVLALLG